MAQREEGQGRGREKRENKFFGISSSKGIDSMVRASLRPRAPSPNVTIRASTCEFAGDIIQSIVMFVPFFPASL